MIQKTALGAILTAALTLTLVTGCGDGEYIPSDVGPADEDGDGVLSDADCDDADPALSEEGLFFADTDGDGLGDPRRSTRSCGPSEGFVDNGDDLEPECATNDTDDCGVCAGPGGGLFFADVDGDGLGDDRIAVSACAAPPGFSAQGGDLEPECATNDTDSCGVCAGGDADKDCLGVCFGPSRLDDCGVCDGPGLATFYPDVDGDGLGDDRSPLDACSRPEGFVDNGDDLEPECATNDTDDCGVCAGPGGGLFFADVDGDGLGDARTSIEACEQPRDFVDNDDDPEPACATNDTDSCGVCAGGDASLDCDGVCDGGASLDDCERCVGGQTGLEPAVEDADGDGTPDLCDEDCVGRRLIVQWTDVPPFGGGGGPYTFQIILSERGDIVFQYGRTEPFRASATVGVQDEGGGQVIEFGFNSEFILEQPTVMLQRDGDRYIVDYAQDLYWLDVRAQGQRLTMADDQEIAVPIGFNFDFYGQAYDTVNVSSNGFVAFSAPFGAFTNVSLPQAELGALIAPFWDDLNPAVGGTVHVLSAPATCASDCNGVVGGFGVEGDCGVCLTGLEDGPVIDCDGVCGGEAQVDGCGICAGGGTGVEPRQRDCNGVCDGEAFIDACRICVGGDTGVEPSDPDACPSGVDLIVDRDFFAETIHVDHVQVAPDDCLINEGCVQGPGDRKVIRFGTRIANIGTEDLRLGTPREGGDFWHFDACHSHFHFEAYAAYDIFDVASNRLLEIGSKNGFCVMDTGVHDPNLAPNGCAGYNCGDQGISAGCQDTYGPGLQCQWIDVTGLPDGVYDLIVTTNPEREIPELSFSNNSVTVRVRLEGETVTRLDEN